MDNEYEKESLLHVELNEEEGKAGTFPDEINLLRGKTFNSELGELIGQIFKNEKKNQHKPESDSTNGITESDTKGNESSGKEDLLYELEKLIYEAKFSGIYSEAPVFQPYMEDVNVYDGIDDLETYMEIAIKQAGFTSFALLKYSVDSAAFLPDLSKFDDDFNTNVCLSVKDNIFRTLLESPTGIFLSKEEMESDLFLSKLFGHNAGDYYLLRVSEIYKSSDLLDMERPVLTDFSEYTSPILILKIDGSTGVETEIIYNSILKYGGMPFSVYLLKNRLYIDLQNYSYDTTLRMINLFSKFFMEKNIDCIVINLVEYSRKDYLFLYKYLLSKIKTLLRDSSFMIRTSIDKTIVVPRNNEMSEITKSVDEFISVNEGMIDYNVMQGVEGFKNFDLIRFFT